MTNKCKCKSKHLPPAGHGLKEEVIRVPKVYDWVNDSITVTKKVFFGEEQLEAIEDAMEDPNRRPLRLVAIAPKTPPLFPMKHSDPDHVTGHGFFCEQIGEKREVVVPIRGEFVNAQMVELLFNAEIEIEVLDRHGKVVTESCVDVSALESFVLCFPDGTELLCRIQTILAEITSGTILLNSTTPKSFTLEVTFCADVQVEAEVKLEVFAKFGSARENNLEAIEDPRMKCPPIHFPAQCPDIYPVKDVCKCSAKGEASGHTASNNEGTAGILVNICSDGNLANSVFDFTFDSSTGSSTDLTFTATEFDRDSFECKDFNHGLKLIVSGDGQTENGRQLNFKLALVDSHSCDQFQVELSEKSTGHVVFNTGVVEVDEGDIVITENN